ncbi:isopentenyl-diphosphate Delta-isomerase [Candidatus Dojkabacteria bacterium]|nr:isopentenyl-diphosphate Delta-isomerase [Candidatus Dojkabacteria bacterium]
MDEIILVNKDDNVLGSGEKLDVHKKGLTHRAFSIFIFNSDGELMLQKRDSGKYHSGGLWTNTCCSHPRKGEDINIAVHRRLKEEMGFDTQLEEKFVFHYRAEFDNGLIEDEVDHVFYGYYDGEPELNPEEAEDWKWISLEDLKEDIKANPENYTAWLREIIGKIDPEK